MAAAGEAPAATTLTESNLIAVADDLVALLKAPLDSSGPLLDTQLAPLLEEGGLTHG